MITFTLDEQDMRSAANLAARWPNRRWVLTISAVLICLAAGGLLLGLAQKFGDLHAIANMLGVTWFAAAAGFLTIAVMRYLWVPRIMRDQLLRDPATRRERILSWDEKGLTAKSENGEILLPWGDLSKWREDDSDILIYRSRVLGMIIPKRAFERPEQLWELQAVLAKKIEREL